VPSESRTAERHGWCARRTRYGCSYQHVCINGGLSAYLNGLWGMALRPVPAPVESRCLPLVGYVLTWWWGGLVYG